MQACAEAGVAVTVVPGVTSAFAAPAVADVPVSHRGVAHEIVVVSGHVAPDDPRSLVDWPALGRLRVDLGAGRVLAFKKLTKRRAVPAAIAGIFSSPDTGATWHVRRGGADTTIAVYGPLVSSSEPWVVNGIDADTVEIVSPGGWIKTTQLAHLERDKTGKITALVVSTGRIKKLRFERTG